MAKPPKQNKPKTNSTPSNTPVGPVAIVNTQGKISVRGIPKPSNISTISITELKRILGFDEMENPRSEWNTSRDAARKIFTVKRFNGQTYQGWARAEAKKKSSARARVLPIIFNFVDLVMKLVKDPRFPYLQGYAGNWPCDIIFVTVSYNSNKIKKSNLLLLDILLTMKSYKTLKHFTNKFLV